MSNLGFDLDLDDKIKHLKERSKKNGRSATVSGLLNLLDDQRLNYSKEDVTNAIENSYFLKPGRIQNGTQTFHILEKKLIESIFLFFN
jgi:hypothetical protein